MNKKSVPLVVNLALVALLISVVCPLEVLARGGGGGSSGGGGLLTIILYPFFIIYGAVVTYLVTRKSRESAELAKKLERYDPIWNLDNIQKQVEATYYKMENAWMKRDQSICRDFVSDRLYSKHSEQTDLMIEQHRQNIMEDINLLEAKVVQVSDFKDDSKDNIWVYIKGSMADYIVDDRSGTVLKGDKTVRPFSELWKFVRQGDRWLLDEVKPSADAVSLLGFHSHTDEQVSLSPRMELQGHH